MFHLIKLVLINIVIFSFIFSFVLATAVIVNYIIRTRIENNNNQKC